MATHSSIFPEKSLGQKSLAGHKESKGSQRVRHNYALGIVLNSLQSSSHLILTATLQRWALLLSPFYR